jgi:hypothetical protein
MLVIYAVSKRPVSTCRQARASPAGPDPGGLVCASRPSLILLYRKPQKKAITNAICTTLCCVFVFERFWGKKVSLHTIRMRQVAKGQMCGSAGARVGCTPLFNTDLCESEHQRPAEIDSLPFEMTKRIIVKYAGT